MLTGQTLAAGCSIALWLLQLLMITPLDEFCIGLPIQIKLPEVYVDDATVTVVARRHLIEDLTVRAAKRLVIAFEEGAGVSVSKTISQVMILVKVKKYEPKNWEYTLNMHDMTN